MKGTANNKPRPWQTRTPAVRRTSRFEAALSAFEQKAKEQGLNDLTYAESVTTAFEVASAASADAWNKSKNDINEGVAAASELGVAVRKKHVARGIEKASTLTFLGFVDLELRKAILDAGVPANFRSYLAAQSSYWCWGVARLATAEQVGIELRAKHEAAELVQPNGAVSKGAERFHACGFLDWLDGEIRQALTEAGVVPYQPAVIEAYGAYRGWTGEEIKQALVEAGLQEGTST